MMFSTLFLIANLIGLVVNSTLLFSWMTIIIMYAIETILYFVIFLIFVVLTILFN